MRVSDGRASGLAVQHRVDPEAVPLELYPKLYVLLFGGLVSPLGE